MVFKTNKHGAWCCEDLTNKKPNKNMTECAILVFQVMETVAEEFGKYLPSVSAKYLPSVGARSHTARVAEVNARNQLTSVVSGKCSDIDRLASVVVAKCSDTSEVEGTKEQTEEGLEKLADR